MPDIGENDFVPEKVVFIVIVIGNVSLEKQLLSSLVYWMYCYLASTRNRMGLAGVGPIISLGQSRRKRELAFQCVSTGEMLLHLWIKTLDFV